MDAHGRGPGPDDNFDDQPPPQQWKYWKFGLFPSDLSTTLAAQYNTVAVRIQSAPAFHHDVAAAAHRARDLAELHALLARRRDQRLAELREAWDGVALGIVCRPADFGGQEPGRWRAFRALAASRALDAVVLFFGSLLPRASSSSDSFGAAYARERETPTGAPPTPSSRSSPPPPPPPPPPPRVSRHPATPSPSSPTLARAARVTKKRNARCPRQERKTGGKESRTQGVQTPPDTPRQQHPARRAKATKGEAGKQTTRKSRRLAGQAPEVEGRLGGG